MFEDHLWFVRAENLREFQLKLEVETDPAKRLLLEKLIAETRAELLPGTSCEAHAVQTKV